MTLVRQSLATSGPFGEKQRLQKEKPARVWSERLALGGGAVCEAGAQDEQWCGGRQDQGGDELGLKSVIYMAVRATEKRLFKAWELNEPREWRSSWCDSEALSGLEGQRQMTPAEGS